MELFKLYGNILIKNDEATKSLHNTQKDALETATKFEKLAESGTSSGSKLNGAFKGVQDVLGMMGVNLSDNAVVWGTWAVAGVAAVAEITKKLYELTSQTADYGDNIDKMSQKLGLSTDAYQKWDYVIGLAGGDIDSMSAGFKSMTNTLADAQNGTQSAIDKFTALGISMDDIKNLDSEQMFEKVVASLQNVDDQTQKAAAANDMFGKSGQNLLPLLNQTNEETQALIDSTSELGLVMSEDSIEASATFKDTQDTIQQALDATTRSLGEKLMPYFQEVLDWVMDHMPEIQNIITTGIDFIVGAIELISPVIEAVLTVVGGLIDGVSAACDMISGIVTPVFEFIEDSLNAIIDLINTVTFLEEAGFDTLHMDAEGYAKCTRKVDKTVPEFIYKANFNPGMTESFDVYGIPNVFVGVVSTPDHSVMTYTAENHNPNSELSIERRGYKLTKVYNLDSIASQQELQDYVDNLLQNSMMAVEGVTFTTEIQPGHDFQNCVQVEHKEVTGLYIEKSWSYSFGTAETMNHFVEKKVII